MNVLVILQVLLELPFIPPIKNANRIGAQGLLSLEYGVPVYSSLGVPTVDVGFEMGRLWSWEVPDKAFILVKKYGEIIQSLVTIFENILFCEM